MCGEVETEGGYVMYQNMRLRSQMEGGPKSQVLVYIIAPNQKKKSYKETFKTYKIFVFKLII